MVTYTCCNPVCGAEVRKYWQPSAPHPKYCDCACSRAGNRLFAFDDLMNQAIRQASREGYGAMKALWRTDPRFEAAGIPYPILKRQCLLLGLTWPRYHVPWTDAELDFAAQRYARGQRADVIARAMQKRGWPRSPGAVHSALSLYGQRAHTAHTSAWQFALALGVDGNTVLRWIARGDLPVHHVAGRTHYLSDEAMRAFVVTYPLRVARGKVDVLWLIGLLARPGAGDTRDGDTDDASGAWLNGRAVADRAAAD